ncbi:MAG TPA: YfiR family protein, partial [Cyclobacteriaceae bacterium]
AIPLYQQTQLKHNKATNTDMKKLTTLLTAIALVVCSHSFAQDRPLHEIYSMMMFNFTRYVQWPTASGNEFVIGVVGNKEVYNTLNTWYAGKPKGSQTFVIKLFKSAAEVTDCAVVFLDKSKSSEFETIKEKVKGKGTLIVTDRDGLGAKGSSINFTTVDNKLKFELNQKAIEASNLKVAGALSSMAILI